MKLIVRPRRGGKTTDLIKAWRADPDTRALVIVAGNVIRSQIIRDFHLARDEQIRIVALDIFTAGGGGFAQYHPIYVDNVELVLSLVLGVTVTMGTVTAELL